MTARVPRLLIAAALAATLAAGCGLPAPHPGSESLSDPASFSGALLSRARHNADAGRLADALADYKALSLLHPEDAGVRDERLALEERIAASAAARLQAGQAALARGRTRAASRHFLAVLAVEPRNRAAFLALRDIETANARRVQQRIGLDTVRAYEAEKERQRGADAARPVSPAAAPVPVAATPPPAAENAVDAALAHMRGGRYAEALAVLQPAARAPDTRDEAERLRATAHLGLARQATAGGDLQRAETNLDAADAANAAAGASLDRDIASARRRLAEAYYTRGLGVFANDLDAAIADWRKSTHLDATNTKVKRMLAQAEKLRTARAIQAAGTPN